MSPSLFLVWLALAVLAGGALFLLAGWLRVRRQIALLAGLLTAVAVLVLLLFLRTSLRPRPVDLHITRPEDGAEVDGHRLLIEGTAEPAEALVTLVIRSETDNIWWVQDLVRPDPASGRWSIESHLGTPREGGGQSFYIVALGSVDPPLTNFLLARRLRTGMVLPAIPRWNQSEPLVVRRGR